MKKMMKYIDDLNFSQDLQNRIAKNRSMFNIGRVEKYTIRHKREGNNCQEQIGDSSAQSNRGKDEKNSRYWNFKI